MTGTPDDGGLVVRVLERFEPLTDRFNPILVKEVRQVLRGRGFGWTFVTLVAVAAIFGAMIVISDERRPSSDLGVNFLSLLHWLFAIGAVVVVPLQAFQSLGSEWESDTYDQLTLSGLTPGQIVRGKLLSAVLQAGLMLFAFAPFLALAFLMRGVDLLALVASIAMLVLVGVWTSAGALAVSAVTSNRAARVVLFVAGGASLFGLTGGLVQAAGFMLEDPATLREPEFWGAAATFVVAGTAAAAFCLTFAAGRLAHPEENASTPLRLVALASTLAVLVWVLVARELGWIPTEAVQFFSAGTAVAASVLSLLWTAERGRLGRRVANDLARPGSPTRRVPSLLLPGGGRGMLFALVLVALPVALSIAFASASSSRFVADSVWFGPALLCYLAFFVGVPTALFARWCEREAGAWAVRLSVVLFVAAATVLPGILGLALRDQDLSGLRHALNPFWVLTQAIEGDLTGALKVAVGALGAIGLVVNAPRMVSGLVEVARARRGEHHEDDPAVLRSRERARAAG